MRDTTQTIPMYSAALRFRNAFCEFQEAKSRLIECEDEDVVTRAQEYMSAKAKYMLAEHDFKKMNREIKRLGKWGSIDEESGSVS